MSTTHREGRWRGRRLRARHGGAKRRSAEGVGSGEGRRSPSPVWGSGGAQKNLQFNSANLFIFSTISSHFATSRNTLQQSLSPITTSSSVKNICRKRFFLHNFCHSHAFNEMFCLSSVVNLIAVTTLLLTDVRFTSLLAKNI